MIDHQTARDLELVQNAATKKQSGSLLGAYREGQSTFFFASIRRS